MAKHGKKADKRGKRGKRKKGSRLPAKLAPVRELSHSAGAGMAVAAGALLIVGITGLWRLRR